MIYRCDACGYKEARGYLPTASRGLYMVALCLLSSCCISGCVTAVSLGLHELRDAPVPAEPVEWPWWAKALVMMMVLILTFIGAVALEWVFELIERLAYARRRCPTCGARRWSRGFTRGFGL